MEARELVALIEKKPDQVSIISRLDSFPGDGGLRRRRVRRSERRRQRRQLNDDVDHVEGGVEERRRPDVAAADEPRQQRHHRRATAAAKTKHQLRPPQGDDRRRVVRADTTFTANAVCRRDDDVNSDNDGNVDNASEASVENNKPRKFFHGAKVFNAAAAAAVVAGGQRRGDENVGRRFDATPMSNAAKELLSRHPTPAAIQRCPFRTGSRTLDRG